MVRARSAALIPVEMPSVASIETVKAVLLRLRLVLVMGARPSCLDALLGQGEADQAAPVPGHEVDRVRGRHLRGDDEVALILAVGVVDQDEHPPVARFVDDRFGADQHAGVAALEQLFEPAEGVGGRIPVGRAKFAQGIGVEAGGAGETGAADFAGGDDGAQLLDQVGAHDRAISHCNVMSKPRLYDVECARAASIRSR